MGDGLSGPCSLEKDVKEIRDMALAHNIRLENGTHAFETVNRSVEKTNKRIDEIDKRTTPVPPSVAKVIAITLTVFMAAATALWGLAQKLSDRPTTDQMQQILHSHDGNGHTQLRKDVTMIRSEQKVQSVIMDKHGRQQTANSKKLDKVLLRLPDQSPNRPRR